MQNDGLEASIRKCYELYVALHRAHKLHPDMFGVSRCNVILTAVLGGHRYGWRVIGITPKALSLYAEHDFVQKPRNGIRRAHIKPRVETAKHLLTRSEPLSIMEFTKIWAENDVTVLCAEGENKTTVPPYIAFDNDNCDLFSGRQVGWRHSAEERLFLKNLADFQLRKLSSKN